MAAAEAKASLSAFNISHKGVNPIQSAFWVDGAGRGIYEDVMPRQRRVEYPGALYHVMSRGDRREDIFLDDVDRHDFIKIELDKPTNSTLGAIKIDAGLASRLRTKSKLAYSN
jgi:hypothetical protein